MNEKGEMNWLHCVAIAGSHEFGDDFIRYLNNMEKMSWEAVSVQ